MNTTMLLIGGCALVTAVIKAVGPVALGGRELPERFTGVIALMAPALLAALVVTATLADAEEWAIGPRQQGWPPVGSLPGAPSRWSGAWWWRRW